MREFKCACCCSSINGTSRLASAPKVKGGGGPSRGVKGARAAHQDEYINQRIGAGCRVPDYGCHDVAWPADAEQGLSGATSGSTNLRKKEAVARVLALQCSNKGVAIWV